MIGTSTPWRAELSRAAENLERRSGQKRWTERAAFEMERDLMVGMFAIRRLIESDKCSSHLPDRRVPVIVCKLTGSEPRTSWDRWSPWEIYDLDAQGRSELAVSNLYGEFIHSFILMLASGVESDSVEGVYVGSDRTKKRHVYYVKLTEVVDLFRYVASEDVVSIQFSRREGKHVELRISNHDLAEGREPARLEP